MTYNAIFLSGLLREYARLVKLDGKLHQGKDSDGPRALVAVRDSKTAMVDPEILGIYRIY
jgi:hypothetical protein